MCVPAGLVFLARVTPACCRTPVQMVAVYVVESADARQSDDDAGGEPSVQQVSLGLLVPRAGRGTDLSDERCLSKRTPRRCSSASSRSVAGAVTGHSSDWPGT
jgi:hypothetical protein